MTPDFDLVHFETPHALTVDEIADTVAQYRHGAPREAGRVRRRRSTRPTGTSSSNSSRPVRTGGAYGGSLENRLRFLREVTEAVLAEWPAERVGARLSLGAGTNAVHDERPKETFGAAAAMLGEAGLVYLHGICPNTHSGTMAANGDFDAIALLRDHFDGAVIANAEFDREEGEAILEAGTADLVAYGRPFLANPDLPIRFAA